MSLLNSLASSKVKIFSSKIPEAKTCSVTLTLHKYAAYLALAGCVIAQSGQYFGEGITCTSANFNEYGSKLVETYCWFQGTFTYKEAFQDTLNIHPGVHGDLPGQDEEDAKISYAYYQWVGLVLLFQFGCFFLPSRIWKRLEGGKVSSILKLIQKEEESGKEEDKDKAGKFLVNHVGTYTLLVVKFIFCELLATVNVYVQILLLDKFFMGRFSDLGHKWLQHDPLNDGPFHQGAILFPRATKCQIDTYAADGNKERRDLVCLLPLNVLYEKLFVLIWFVYICLAVFSTLKMLLHAVLFVSANTRSHMLRSKSPRTPKGLMRTVVRLCDFGDWFILSLVAENVDQAAFKRLLEYVGRNLRVMDVDLDLESNEPIRTTRRRLTNEDRETATLTRKISNPPGYEYDMANFDNGKIALV